MSNIVLDFTKNQAIESLVVNQPVAVLPAELAKKLLKDYARRLTRVRLDEIKEELIASINAGENMDNLMQTSIQFVQEHELIQNVVAENWDAYSVEKVNH